MNYNFACRVLERYFQIEANRLKPDCHDKPKDFIEKVVHTNVWNDGPRETTVVEAVAMMIRSDGLNIGPASTGRVTRKCPLSAVISLKICSITISSSVGFDSTSCSYVTTRCSSPNTIQNIVSLMMGVCQWSSVELLGSRAALSQTDKQPCTERDALSLTTRRVFLREVYRWRNSYTRDNHLLLGPKKTNNGPHNVDLPAVDVHVDADITCAQWPRVWKRSRVINFGNPFGCTLPLPIILIIIIVSSSSKPSSSDVASPNWIMDASRESLRRVDDLIQCPANHRQSKSNPFQAKRHISGNERLGLHLESTSGLNLWPWIDDWFWVWFCSLKRNQNLSLDVDLKLSPIREMQMWVLLRSKVSRRSNGERHCDALKTTRRTFLKNFTSFFDWLNLCQ